MKGICEAIKNEATERKGRFLPMLSGSLDASLLERLLGIGRQVIRVSE